MCSRVETEKRNLLEQEEPLVSASTCIKCKEAAAVVNIRYAIYCNDCFLEQTFYKYRAAVAKAKSEAASGPERIVLALSKGNASRILLYFSQLPRIKDPRRKNLDIFIPIFIVTGEGNTDGDSDVGAKGDGGVDEYEEAERVAIYIKQEYNLDLIIVHISKIMSMAPVDLCDQIGKSMPSSLSLATNCSLEEQMLQDFMQQISTQTSRTEALYILQRILLVHLAYNMNCTKVYFPDTNNRMAVNIIADVCYGRGIGIPWDLEPIQSFAKLPSVAMVKPMREILDLEVEHYLNIVFPTCPLATEAASLIRNCSHDDKKTILGLTDTFLSSLDRDFSSTASTVTKTASKLTTNKVLDDCRFCWRPTDDASLALCRACKLMLPKDVSKWPEYCKKYYTS